MNIKFKGKTIYIFTHPHRTYNYDDYVSHHKKMFALSEQFECEGMLCSTSSYDYFEAWTWAQFLLSNTNNLKPFVAVNPVYMHPFTATRFVASLSHLYNRKIWLNFITGSAINDMQQVNDFAVHAQRYERLKEYIHCMKLLLESQLPAIYSGKYFQLNKSTLMTKMTDELQPGITISGESTSAKNVYEYFNYPNLVMLPSVKISYENIKNKSLAFGIVTRETTDAAWLAANELYKDDRFGQKLLKASMLQNETSWKKRIFSELEKGEVENPLYWLGPFKNKHADCPYIVGSFADVKKYIIELCEADAHSFVLTIKNEKEFEYIRKIFSEIE